MNRLQRRAWIDLAIVTACVALGGAGVGLMVHLNAKGIVGLMSFLICGLIIGLISSLRSIAIQAKFDEREKKIALRAFIISSYFFVIFLGYASFTVFFIVGGKSSTPTYTLPVLFLIGLFLSQFVQSAAILIQFTREQADEQ
jgi:uncharacterized membrane protein (DUF485 family)